MRRTAFALLLAATLPAQPKLKALIVDGRNNHDWQAATRFIQSTLEGSGRFEVSRADGLQPLQFAGQDVVILNFNSGHTANAVRWSPATEKALEQYVRNGGGLVVYHAANNAFLEWPAYNDMIGLGWRDRSFGPGLAIVNDKVVTIPKGQGNQPGHGPRHDFDVFVLDKTNPITAGIPAHWSHPSEQLTHGQHGSAAGLDVLTYAFSEVTHQGEPMDWTRSYGKGRVYTTMLGHTWQNETNPNLDDLHFQTLLARGAEWAATGKVTLPVGLGWKPMFKSATLDGWEPRGNCEWTWTKDGVLIGQRTKTRAKDKFNDWFNLQAWIYTNRNDYTNFDLHVEYWLPPNGNSGVSIRDPSRAQGAIGEPGPYKTTPAHLGYEIQIYDDDNTKYPSGSIYSLVPAKTGVHRRGEWNSLEIESRPQSIRVRLNGQIVAEGPGDAARPKSGPIGLQLHDQLTWMMFRNIRIRELQ